MSAALAELSTVDLVLVECRLPGCLLRFVENDGWLGECPSCAALADEHETGAHGGAHGGSPVPECRDCW